MLALITKENIVKFLKDYCYAIYLGVFGAWLVGLWGVIVFGAIGLFYDYRINKEKFYKQYLPKKETFLGSRWFRSRLDEYWYWEMLLRCCLWVIVIIFWSYIFMYIVVLHNVSFGLRDVMYLGVVEPKFWSTPLGKIAIRMSCIVPYLDKYIDYMNVHAKDFLNKPQTSNMVTSISAMVYSLIWILCIVRSPKLFHLVSGMAALFNKNVNLLRNKIYIALFVIIIFLLLFYNIFVGGGIFFPKVNDNFKFIFYLYCLLIPLMWIFMAVVLSVVSSIKENILCLKNL